MKKEEFFSFWSKPCYIIIGFLILITALLVFRTPYAPTDTMRHTLSVTGNSEIEVAPDKALVYVSIITDNADAKKAQQDNSISSNAVIEALKTWGVSPSDIETQTYSLVRKQEWDPKENRYVEGDYRLTHTLRVTTKRIDSVGELVDTAVNAGANTIESVTFTLTDESERKVRDQALAKAAEVARQKAQTLASNAGATLGQVTIVEEQSFYYRPFNYEMKAAGAESAPTQISPQMVQVTSSVRLVFEIG